MNWNNEQDRKDYYELLEKKQEELNEKQKRYITDMYHQEEYYAYGEI